MKYLIFFLIVCLSSLCRPAISQPNAPNQRNKADSLMNEGNVPEAIAEELYPLEDETKVDEWRKELGLEPLAEYLARLNIKFQPKQKPD